MYNFSGIWFRIWGVRGILFLAGIVLLLLEKPWSHHFSLKKCKIALLAITCSVLLGFFYAYRIFFPDIASYRGEFLNSHRVPNEAPPLPVTYEYVFWNGEGLKQPFYLDIFSKKEIFPDEFQPEQDYRIYFDMFTDVIVKVETENEIANDEGTPKR